MFILAQQAAREKTELAAGAAKLLVTEVPQWLMMALTFDPSPNPHTYWRGVALPHGSGQGIDFGASALGRNLQADAL